MIQQYISDKWQMRRMGGSLQPAVVPGTVYTDLLRNGNMEDPFWKDNEIRALPLMEDDYEYEVCFDSDEEMKKQDQVLLHFDGLDTIADIYLNQKHIGKAYNMHRIWEYDATDCLREKENLLQVCVCLWKANEGVRHPGARVTGSCETQDTGAEDLTQVLWESCTHS